MNLSETASENPICMEPKSSNNHPNLYSPISEIIFGQIYLHPHILHNIYDLRPSLQLHNWGKRLPTSHILIFEPHFVQFEQILGAPRSLHVQDHKTFGFYPVKTIKYVPIINQGHRYRSIASHHIISCTPHVSQAVF